MEKNAGFVEIWNSAKAAGIAAGEAVEVAPMVVVAADIFNRPVPGATRHVVEGGPCGFAGVIIRPANSAFANFIKKNGIGRKSYSGGVRISIMEFGQSLARKEAMAYAMAGVMQKAGINAYGESRID